MEVEVGAEVVVALDAACGGCDEVVEVAPVAALDGEVYEELLVDVGVASVGESG